MLDLAMPKIEAERAAENYARFRIEPLEPGYGHTIGNALRRVLLSSIPGSAITKIKIDGVYHEFSTLPGVREDVTELVLNLKGVRLRSYAERPVKVHLSKVGRGVVRAGDIEAPSNVEVVNPDHYIATLDGETARLDIEMTVERGKGYLPVENRDPVPIGEIPIDAIFTPIPRVNYVVENMRIGGVTDYDRLILEIWTDGTIKPGDALRHAAQVLGQYSQTIADFSRPEQPAELAPANGSEGIAPDVYDASIDELELSTRTYNCLKRADITKIGQLLQMDEKDLLSVRNLGSKSIDEIKEKLIERGYLPRPDTNPGARAE
ncbi:DNA-directed RNA polymerase subunit alpha [Kallotenue papyrolyticum]|uniref:DNA-directed RNA polymerase subunit alpha n=1 Tax=Kallotenue papyrolyticum TaxID=1325125 RepID=UPI000478666A|nr:DNA-directed RNA polymerase subunit alpha [Kallotenue papyrolyticum]